MKADGPSRVRIRPVTERDITRLARLHALSQRTTYASLLPGDAVGGIDDRASRTHWRRRLGSPGLRSVLVAHDGERGVVGFGMVSAEPMPWATLNALHVHPALHGRGIGAALLQRLVDIGRSWQGTGVQLYVLAGNRRARDFYEHLGWRCRGSGVPHAIAGVPVETVRYELLLNPGGTT